MDHNILLNLLGKRIKDKKFLKLIHQLLKSGILDQNKFEHSLSGTPQGGIVSPLLFNIYMFELDKFIYENIIKEIQTKPLKQRKDKTWQNLGYKIKKLYQQWKSSSLDNKAKELYLKPLKELQKKRLSIFSYDIKSIPKTVVYARYADDWVLLITESKQDADTYKRQIRGFIKDTLRMTLDPNKTLISHLDDGFSFLGFTIKRWKPNQLKIKRTLISTKQDGKPASYRTLVRTTSRKITIIPDQSRIYKRLLLGGFCQNQLLEPIGIRSWASFDEYEIVLKYRRIIIGLTNYYRHCDSHYVLNRVSYMLQYSCAKTLAVRLKISMSEVFSKYGKNFTIRKPLLSSNSITHRTVSFPTLSDLRNQGRLKRSQNSILEYDPFKIEQYWRTKFKVFSQCCICGSTEEIALDHINSLGSIKPGKRDKYEYIRSRLNRIQIPVCPPSPSPMAWRSPSVEPPRSYSRKI